MAAAKEQMVHLTSKKNKLSIPAKKNAGALTVTEIVILFMQKKYGGESKHAAEEFEAACNYLGYINREKIQLPTNPGHQDGLDAQHQKLTSWGYQLYASAQIRAANVNGDWEATQNARSIRETLTL